jgi:hypothetical protein
MRNKKAKPNVLINEDQVRQDEADDQDRPSNARAGIRDAEDALSHEEETLLIPLI